ncbi:hypothetical protein [Pinirhizobacter soli]|uniref:hypothetical protein n=1 Tax=Pinirhizobacter soli TaxID=2786953 RepID=UPI00202A1C25|nr:hypothetical protein [Pinirhizobacter soli]
MEIGPDIDDARLIVARLTTAGSYEAVGELIREIAEAEEPKPATVALAIAWYGTEPARLDFSAIKRTALKGALQVELAKSQIVSQERLSTAADRLAKRNYYVATASLIVAGVSLLATTLQLFFAR